MATWTVCLQAYAELLEENGIRIPAWFSFTKDGVNTASGDPITECAAVADSCQRMAAVGVNCTAPRLIHGLILSIKKVHLSGSTLCQYACSSYYGRIALPTEKHLKLGNFISR